MAFYRKHCFLRFFSDRVNENYEWYRLVRHSRRLLLSAMTDNRQGTFIIHLKVLYVANSHWIFGGPPTKKGYCFPTIHSYGLALWLSLNERKFFFLIIKWSRNYFVWILSLSFKIPWSFCFCWNTAIIWISMGSLLWWKRSSKVRKQQPQLRPQIQQCAFKPCSPS